MTQVTIHKVVNIKQIVRHYDTFSTYTHIATNKDGEELEVVFFHTHKDALVHEPYVENIIEPRRTEDENE
jgi:hypothetical protein